MNNRIENLKPSASLVFMRRAKEMQKKDPSVIGLAGGEPDFTTPARISMEAIRSLAEGNTHYVVGPGIPELRKGIQKKLKEENGIECDMDSILLTPGGKNAIYLAIQALLNEGDEAIILNPAWVSYVPIVQAAGGKAVEVDLDYRQNYRITQEILEEAYTEKTRLLIINYPNNPTGRILHEEEADVLEKFLQAHPDVYILSDEVYESIVYDRKKSVSMASRESVKERVITVNGFSKCAAMTGWRIGYLTCSAGLFSVVYKLYQHSLSCMSGFLQAGAAAVFECRNEMDEMCRIYRERRDRFVEILNSINGVRCPIPEGAFYAWVYYDLYGMTSEEICEYLLEKAGVVGMPGSAYGEKNVCCMRFSFANSMDELEDAGIRIKKAIEELHNLRRNKIEN